MQGTAAAVIARWVSALALAAPAGVLTGCALTAPDPAPVPGLPAGWIAPQPPHDGKPAALAQWWSQFDDPLLVRLIDATQNNNGTLAQAAARIGQARAAVAFAAGGAWPQLNAQAGATRSRSEVPPPSFTQTGSSAGIDALWEIDIAGVTRNNVRAARARADSAGAAWHDLRISLAAEVASDYVSLRACEALVDIYRLDTSSQRRTAELTQVKAKAGLESPANSALANASAADASNRLVAQRAECDLLIKALVALTALDENMLRAELVPRAARLPQPRLFAIESLPARWLQQRPDLAALQREVGAAAAEVGAAQADRYPRLSLSGTISAVRARISGLEGTSGSGTTHGTQWSIGPALSLPLFDAGRRAANVDAAQARYLEVRARYEQRAREAVREVEEALVRLDAATRREADAQQAAQGFRQFFESAQSRWDVGTGSLLDLEDARRIALTAAAGVVAVQRERVTAWIALYKAVGGGWDPPQAQAMQQDVQDQRISDRR